VTLWKLSQAIDPALAAVRSASSTANLPTPPKAETTVPEVKTDAAVAKPTVPTFDRDTFIKDLEAKTLYRPGAADVVKDVASNVGAGFLQGAKSLIGMKSDDKLPGMKNMNQGLLAFQDKPEWADNPQAQDALKEWATQQYQLAQKSDDPAVAARAVRSLAALSNAGWLKDPKTIGYEYDGRKSFVDPKFALQQLSGPMAEKMKAWKPEQTKSYMEALGSETERNELIKAIEPEVVKNVNNFVKSSVDAHLKDPKGVWEYLTSNVGESWGNIAVPASILLMLFGGNTGAILGAIGLAAGGANLYGRYKYLQEAPGAQEAIKFMQAKGWTPEAYKELGSQANITAKDIQAARDFQVAASVSYTQKMMADKAREAGMNIYTMFGGNQEVLNKRFQAEEEARRQEAIRQNASNLAAAARQAK
jgi:hypothetical protein